MITAKEIRSLLTINAGIRKMILDRQQKIINEELLYLLEDIKATKSTNELEIDKDEGNLKIHLCRMEEFGAFSEELDVLLENLGWYVDEIDGNIYLIEITFRMLVE